MTGRPRKPKPPPLDAVEVIQLIREERGLLGPAAERLGVTRTHLRKFVMNRPTVVEVLKECRDALGDLAELKLYDLIEAGDFRAITFYLSTMCRDRGYSLPKGTALMAETTNTLVVDTVNIVTVPPGRFVMAEGELAHFSPDHPASSERVIDERPLLRVVDPPED